MRLLVLLLGAAAAAAAARVVLNRSRAGSGALTPPPTPTPVPPVPSRDAVPEPTPARDDAPGAPGAPGEPPPSAVSPATETVRANAGQIDPADVTLPDDREVEREVEAQLAASPVAAEADITVEVRDRVASLEGSAPDPETALAIGDEAAHVDGVQGLDNRLRAEREAAAEADDDAREPAGEDR
jgi:hypothetical protein